MPEEHHPWETISYRQIIDTPFLKVRSEEVAIPNGPVISDYYIIENRGWVGVVPVTDDGRFLINKQYKHGIGREVLEFPAGPQPRFGARQLQPAEIAPELVAKAIESAIAAGWEPLSRGKPVAIVVDATGG